MKNTSNLSGALANCINKCNTCAIECIDSDNPKMMAECIKTDLICAEICATLLQLIQLQQEDLDGLVQYCIQVCEDCKETCEQHDHDHCKACAQACGACLDACNQYLN